MSRLLITGSLAYDFILEYPGTLEGGLGQFCQEKDGPTQVRFHTPRLKKYFGGCGGNVCYTLGLLGESPRLLANAGGGALDYIRHLEGVGVDCSHVELIPGGQTATCVIINDEVQNRVVAFHGGVVDKASELDLLGAVDDSVSGCIITPDDVPAMVKFAKSCRQLKLPFYFDFGSQVTWLSADELRGSLLGARAAFCNEYEFSMFEKKTGWSMDDLLARVPVMMVTKGGAGSTLHQRGQKSIDIPACPVKSDDLDPSGAGDAFRAGFGFSRLRDWPLVQSARLASTAAAFALESQGTQGHQFCRRTLIQRCHQVYGPIPEEFLRQMESEDGER